MREPIKSGQPSETSIKIVESSHTVMLPDVSFLLFGDLSRSGFDLVITNPAGEKFVVADYFAFQPPPSLMLANGIGLTPGAVSQLMPAGLAGVMFAGPATSGAVLEQIGTVRFLRGDVTIERADGTVVQAERGTLVYQGDHIKTGANSFVNIRMLDNTRFNLGRNAEATLNDFEFEPENNVGKFDVMVRAGGFKYKSGGIGELGDDNSHTRISTPSAIIRVRGSELEGAVDPTTGETVVVHQSGILEITDIFENNPVELTIPGQTTTVTIGGAPSFLGSTPPEQVQILQDALPPQASVEADDQIDQEDADEIQGENEEESTEAGTTDDSGDDIGDGGRTLESSIYEESILEEPTDDPASPDTGTQDDPVVTETTSTTTTTVVVSEDEPTSTDETTDPIVELPPDFPPVAENDEIAVLLGETLDLTPLILANDSDPDAGQTLQVTEVIGDPRGTLELIDGVLTYTADQVSFSDLERGQSTTTSFGYRITTDALTDTATVTLTISAINAIPQAVDDAISTDENTSVVANVIANDTDGDGDGLTITAINTSATLGLVSLNTDGSVTYDPHGQFGELTSGESATDSFTYTVDDGFGGTATATVTITIAGVNTAPVPVADAVSTDEATSVLIDVLANDVDDDGDPLTVGSIDTTGTIGLASVNPDGSILYDPDGQFEALAAGTTATDSFTYTVNDGNGGAATASVTVTISGVNDAPVAASDTFSAAVGQVTVLDVLANDTDIDGDPLTVSVGGLSELAGSLAVNPDGTISYTPNPLFDELDQNETFADQFVYTVTDPTGATSTATATVNIGPDNSVPNAVDDDFTALPYTTTVTGDVLANDFGGSGNISVLGFDHDDSFGAEVAYNGDGTFSVFYRPFVSFDGEVSEIVEEPQEIHFNYTIVDDLGETSTGFVSVLVSDFTQATRTEILSTTILGPEYSDTSDLFINHSILTFSGTNNFVDGFVANLDSFSLATGSDLTVGKGIDNHSQLMLGDTSVLTLDGGTFRSFGQLSGTGTIDVTAASFLHLGNLSPGGTGVGTLTIVGDPNDSESIRLEGHSNLEIELGDFSAGSFDQLAITGSAHLGGDVRAFSFASAVTSGASIDIISTTDGYTGEIRNFELPVLGGLVINPIQDGNTVTLELVSPTTIASGNIAPDPGFGEGEIVLGSTGSDVFDLSADAIGDSFYGDQGSDTFIIGDLNFKRIDGGGALEFDGDTLKFTTPDFDLRNVTANQIDSVDTIDMRDGQAGTLQLSVDSALNIGRFLLIAADAGDHIILDAERSGFVFDNFDFGSGGLGDLFFLGGENERQEFATLLVSNEATAQINEANGDITYLGSINADQLTGTAADETFFGREGDDQISAGAGHDTIFYGPDDVTLVDGGDGFDMLIPDASRLASAIDLTTNNPYVNFEIIDLQGQFRDQGESNTLILDMADVGQMGRPNLLFGDGTTQLIIEGTIDDYVILNGQNLREGDPAGLVKGTDSRFPDFVSYSDGTNQILVETTLLGPGVNHAPVPEPDKFTTRGTQAIVLDVLANDRDPDPGDTVTMDFVPSTSDQGASLVLNPDGTIDYDPSGLFFSTQITDTFQYSVIDSNGVTSTTHVDIVIEANTPPEVPANVQGIGVESTTADSFTVDLLATAFDEEGDTLSVDPATISFTGDDSGITLDGNTLIVDPSHLAYADAGSTISYTYEIVDGFGGRTFAAADIRIAGPATEFTGSTGLFSDGANWVGGLAPVGSTDVALIPAGLSATSISSPFIDTLELRGTLVVDDGGFDTFNLVLGPTATLDIGAGLYFAAGNTVRLDSGSAITGTGEFRLNGGFNSNLDLPNGYTVTDAPWRLQGGLNIVGGSFAIGSTGVVKHDNDFVVVNTVDFSNAGTLSIGGGDFAFPHLHLHSGLFNTGTVTLDSFALEEGYGATLDVFGGELVNQGIIESKDTAGLGAFSGDRLILGNVLNEGQINVDYDLTIDTTGGALVNSATGVINVASLQTLTVLDTGDFGIGEFFNEGTIDLNATNTTDGEQTILDVSGIEFFNAGVIQGFGTIIGTVIDDGGTINLGASPGYLEIDGDYSTSEKSTLAIEIAGDQAGVSYDQLVVSGRADLNGRLNVSLLNGFMPVSSAGFVILMAGTLEGSFAVASGLDISDELVLDLNYVDDRVALVSVDVTKAGTNHDDVLSGSAGQDTSQGGDVIVAGAGDDVMVGLGAGDIAYGQEGDDTFGIESSGFNRIDGGDGIDTIQVGAGVDLAIFSQPGTAIDHIEILDLRNASDDQLVLDAAAIRNMVDAGGDNPLVLLGEAGDELDLRGDFELVGERAVEVNGVEMNLLELSEGDTSILVSQEIAVTIYATDGSVTLVDDLIDTGPGSDTGPDTGIVSDSIDFTGLDALAAQVAAIDSNGSVADLSGLNLQDLLSDGSEHLDSLLGGRGNTEQLVTHVPMDDYSYHKLSNSDGLGPLVSPENYFEV